VTCSHGTCRTCLRSVPMPSRRTTATTRPAWWARWRTGRPRRSANSTWPIPARWCRHEGVGMRKILLLLLLAAVLVLLVLFVYAKLPTATRAITASGSAERAELIERGRYVATASDCVACHTAPGGEEFAGGLPIA